MAFPERETVILPPPLQTVIEIEIYETPHFKLEKEGWSNGTLWFHFDVMNTGNFDLVQEGGLGVMFKQDDTEDSGLKYLNKRIQDLELTNRSRHGQIEERDEILYELYFWFDAEVI